MSPPPEHLRVAIIGAGFAGLGAAIRLKQEGVGPLVVLERADEVGGTWRANHYPGCCCDFPSHVYSYSFERNRRGSAALPRSRRSSATSSAARRSTGFAATSASVTR